MVNHYELENPYNKNSKTKFKVKLLNNSTDKEIQNRGRRYIYGMNMTKKRLQDITQELIDLQFLDDKTF